MLPKRLRISKASTEAMKAIKARTGLTPNIIGRVGLILSLEDGSRGGLKNIDQAGSEFNAPTLFGELGPFIDCMIREVHGELDAKTMSTVIASHIEDGVERLKKSRTLHELVEHIGFSRG